MFNIEVDNIAPVFQAVGVIYAINVQLMEYIFTQETASIHVLNVIQCIGKL
jgi:DNA-binding IclR family transcriptional regulator